MIPTKTWASSVDRKVVAKETAPTQLEHSPLGLGQGHESITGVTEGIGLCGAKLCQPIGQALMLLNQDIATGEGLTAHAIEHALKLCTVPPMWPRTKFVRQLRNILTEIVHESPLD